MLRHRNNRMRCYSSIRGLEPRGPGATPGILTRTCLKCRYSFNIYPADGYRAIAHGGYVGWCSKCNEEIRIAEPVRPAGRGHSVTTDPTHEEHSPQTLD